MKNFTPFANEADVVTIGHLQFENRLDRITLSGDVDLTLDQAGLEQARALQAMLDEIVRTLEGQTLPAHIPTAPVKMVKNPFD